MTTFETIIEERERGLLYKDGRLIEWLTPGRHRRRAWRAEWRLVRIPITEGYSEHPPELERMMPEGSGQIVSIKAHQLAVLTVDEQPVRVLEPGRCLLWQLRAEGRACARDLPSQLYPYGAYYYAYDAYTKEQIVRWVKGWT